VNTRNFDISRGIGEPLSERIRHGNDTVIEARLADNAMGLLEAARDAVIVLRETGNILVAWAEESRTGGWSTHQVAENQKQAIALFSAANRIEKQVKKAVEK
jgi:hypothetical protein